MVGSTAGVGLALIDGSRTRKRGTRHIFGETSFFETRHLHHRKSTVVDHVKAFVRIFCGYITTRSSLKSGEIMNLKCETRLSIIMK